MASKVMVKIPATSFGQGQMNKTKSNSVAGVESPLPIPRGIQECGMRGHEAPPQQHLEGSRVLQLEQNIRFLQEQHQLMLTGLHKEIESLRNKNRDLHFQLVFAKGSLPSSPSSPEEESKTKVYSSPKPVNVTPLQVEILEKEIGELKSNLNECEHENARLTEALDEYKKKLDELERAPAAETSSSSGSLSEKREQELVEAAGELQVVVRRLRQENASLRREKAALAGSLVASRAASQGMFCPLGGFSNGYHQLPARGEHMPSGYQGAPRGHGQQPQGRNGRYRGSNGAGGYNRGPSQSTSPSIQGQTYWPRVRPERPPPADEEGVLLPSLAQPGSAGGGHQNHRRSANNNHPRRIRGRGGEPS